MQRKTHYPCFLLMLILPMAHASLISLVYPALLLGWGALQLPQPTTRFWQVVIYYTLVRCGVGHGERRHEERGHGASERRGQGGAGLGGRQRRVEHKKEKVAVTPRQRQLCGAVARSQAQERAPLD